MAYTAKGAPTRKGIISRKLAIVMGGAAVAFMLLLILYFYLSFAAIANNYNHPNAKAIPPKINASIQSQDILTYSNSKQLVPFILVSYTSSNASSAIANASIFKYPPPSMIYVLNISNECFSCGNTAAIISSLSKNLQRYGLIKGMGNISTISLSNIRSLPPNSILVILNGLIPASMLNSSSGTNISDLTYLLNRHTSIIYVGDDFSRMLLPDSIVVPTPQSLKTAYLATKPFSGNALSGSFYFNGSTFSFSNGTNYGSVTYTNAYNGSIVAFSSTPNSWPSNESGADVAKSIRLLFWLPKYAYGSRELTFPATKGSQFGILLNSIQIFSNSTILKSSRNSTIRVAITANTTYAYARSNDTYKYIYTSPSMYSNGSISISDQVITNQSVPINFTIYTHSSVPINITPSLTIYNTNLTPVYNLPLPFIHGVPNNFTFLRSEVLLLPPARAYILKLHNFLGVEYSAALFNVSPVSITPISQNLTNGSFVFSATSQSLPITNIPYSISLNNLYPSNGVITNGRIIYYLPKGTPAITGGLNFSMDILGSKSYYQEQFYNAPFSINEQYIEIAIVVAVMLVMIIFVRAPNNDEFYIDVPGLPEEKKIPISLKAQDVVYIFDKLNVQYHWKYMPLSKTEIRSAISNYIRYNNIPVSLTYNNVERILDKLVVNKYLIAADNLYAPTQWTEQSGHDIDYLATFKKMRIYLVTHAYIFTDLDMSQNADMVATLRNEKKYIVIYSKTSKFQKVPIYKGYKTYIVFLNSYKLEEFKEQLYGASTIEAEELKMYIGAEYVKLVDADNPNEMMN